MKAETELGDILRKAMADQRAGADASSGSTDPRVMRVEMAGYANDSSLPPDVRARAAELLERLERLELP